MLLTPVSLEVEIMFPHYRKPPPTHIPTHTPSQKCVTDKLEKVWRELMSSWQKNSQVLRKAGK